MNQFDMARDTRRKETESRSIKEDCELELETIGIVHSVCPEEDEVAINDDGTQVNFYLSQHPDMANLREGDHVCINFVVYPDGHEEVRSVERLSEEPA